VSYSEKPLILVQMNLQSKHKSGIANNMLGLCDVADFKAQMPKLELLFNRITVVQFCTSAPILPRRC
jgi:hypothetical protein